MFVLFMYYATKMCAYNETHNSSVHMYVNHKKCLTMIMANDVHVSVYLTVE